MLQKTRVLPEEGPSQGQQRCFYGFSCSLAIFLGKQLFYPPGILTIAWLIAELGKMHCQPQCHPGGDLVCSWRVTEHLSLPFLLKWGQ